MKDTVKIIKLVLDNPANNLTTTTRSLLESHALSLELDSEILNDAIQKAWENSETSSQFKEDVKAILKIGKW
jgi:hypothetical protein